MLSLNKLRFKLTLTYTLILAGISIISAIVLFLSIYYAIEGSSTRNLRLLATQLATSYDQKTTHNDPEATEPIISALNDEDTTYQIYNDNLDIVEQSPGFQLDSDTSFYLVQKFFNLKRETGDIVDFGDGGSSYKICTSAYVSTSGDLIVVQLIRNMSTFRSLFRVPLITAILVILVGIAISYIIGSLLAGRTIKPIRENIEREQTFLANASHELRTPLAVIMTNLEAEKVSENGDTQWVNNALTEVKFARNVIDDLLFLAKADSGEKHFTIEDVDLSYLVLELTEKLQPIAEQKGIALIADISDYELITKGDSAAIEQVLTILIDNALKYSGDGEEVLVSLTSTQSTITLSVKDYGIGISKDDQEKIFDRFYRVDKNRSRKEGGTGLGLSIARLICEELGINLGIKSELGEGTTFVLVFDRVKEEDSKN